MSTIMTRHARLATAAGEEPEPQHDRDTSIPDRQPPLPRRTRGASLGLIDDITDEDDRRGFEAEPDPLTQFHGLVRHLRLDGDRRASAAGRCAPRTVDQRRVRLAMAEVA